MARVSNGNDLTGDIASVGAFLEYILPEGGKYYPVVHQSFNSICNVAAKDRPGILSYSLSVSTKSNISSEEPFSVYFTEIFASQDDWNNHLSENEGESIVEMFEKKYIKSGTYL